MAFSGQQLSFSSGPDELLPIGSPTGEPTIVRTIVDGTTVMTATSAGVSITPSGPEIQLSTPITPAMSPYNVALTDVSLLCSTSGAISVVLPTAASSTYRVIQIVDASGGAASNNITITVSGGGTINGSASYVINLAYGTATFVSTGAFWVVTNKIAASGGGGGGYATGVRQVVASFTGSVSSTTTQLPADNTPPQNTEGAQFLTATITPQSATSNLLVMANVGASTPSAIATVTAALFRDSATSAFAVAAEAAPNINAATPFAMSFVVASGSTSATTFRLRMGMNTAGTLYFNGYSGPTTYFGGLCASGLTIIEYGV